MCLRRLALVQACIAAKLADFPQKIRTNIHHAAAVIPTRLASALQQDPQLLAPAVQSFYYRDPEDLKAARSMAHFPQDCVSLTSHTELYVSIRPIKPMWTAFGFPSVLPGFGGSLSVAEAVLCSLPSYIQLLIIEDECA